MHLVLILALGGIVASAAQPAVAQNHAELWAGLVKTKGYVVGSPLASSGLHRFDGDTTWTHVGWNIPRVSGLAFDPSNPEIMFLAAGNGMLRTTDGGHSWRITTGWEVTEAQDVAVDPRAGANVYAATAYGVWSTTDGGRSWKESTAALPEKYTQAVAVDRVQAGRVLIGTWGGLYVSEDAGQSWELVGPEGVPVHDLQQSAADPQTWLAATQDHGVLISDDAGRQWRPAGDDMDGMTVLAVAIDPFDPATMAAAGFDGVFVSTDGGRRWEQRAKGLPVPETYEVVFDAVEPGRLWAATVEHGIYYSDDPEAGWQYAGMHGALVFDMTFIESAPK